MKIDISSEIRFRTARSGGKGGQNVNKVETMVEGLWEVMNSQLLQPEQKEIIGRKLSNRISKNGILSIKSQTERTQLANKQQVIEKMNLLVNQSLRPKQPRIATKPTRVSREKRIESKKRKAFVKEGRRKIKISNA